LFTLNITDQDRSEILQERIKNKTESDERKQEKKNEVLKNITEIGIWQNINEITSEEHYGPFNCWCGDIWTETQFLI
jgi:hypothetical protein